MRIGFAIPTTFCIDAPGNGIRVQAQRQAESLRALGHEVLELNPWQSRPSPPLEVFHYFLGGFLFFGVTGLSGGRKKVFAPIIDSNEPHWRYRLAARLGNVVPKVYTVPGEFRQQALNADLVICRSQSEQRRVVSGLGIDVAKTAIVLNGVNPPPPADPSLAHARLGSDEPFVLHVGRFTESRKNVGRLVDAVAPLGLKLVIAGAAEEGPLLNQLREHAAKNPKIVLLDYLEPNLLQSMYAACRVFALPSEHEGTGLVALEAACHGPRIVITRNGGTADYFKDLAEYVDPASVESIRAAIQRAWQANANDRLQQHVRNNLTWEASAQQLVAAYQR